jgi:hypothetical protein
MVTKTLFKYVFPTQIATSTPSINLDFLKKLLVVVVDPTLLTNQPIVEITKTTIPVGLEFLNGAFNGGLDSIYLYNRKDADLTADEDYTETYFNVMFVAKDGTLLLDDDIKISHNGEIGKVILATTDTTIYTPYFGDNYTALYSIAILLTGQNYSSRQYFTTTDSNVIKLENINDLNNLFPKAVFWGRDIEFGVRLYGSFSNGKDVLAKHIVNEVVYRVKDIQLKYITANTPKKNEVVRALLENKAIQLIRSVYVDAGLINEEFTYKLKDTGTPFTFESNFDFTVNESLWKIENNIVAN